MTHIKSISYYQNKTVFITGGASGLGFEMAKQLSASGAKAIALFDVADASENAAELHLARSASHASLNASAYQVDTTNNEQVKAVFTQAVNDLGVADIIIHCAGINRAGVFNEQDASDFELVTRVNLFGSRNVAAASFPILKQSQGRYLIIASLAGIVPNYGYSAYAASKFATLSLAEILRYEWLPEGVSVSMACPPEIPTPLVEEEVKVSHTLTKKLKHIAGVVDLDKACFYILHKTAKGKFKIIPGFKAKIVALNQAYFPGLNRWIVDWIIRRHTT